MLAVIDISILTEEWGILQRSTEIRDNISKVIFQISLELIIGAYLVKVTWGAFNQN